MSVAPVEAKVKDRKIEKTYRPLFLVDNAEAKKLLQTYCKEHKELSAWKSKNKFIYTTKEKFESKGPKLESFDFCIYFKPTKADGGESSDEEDNVKFFEFIKSYFIAPICGVVRKKMEFTAKAEFVKEIGEVNRNVKYCFYEIQKPKSEGSDDSESDADKKPKKDKPANDVGSELYQCIEKCIKAHKNEMENKVKEMFEKYDTDNGGSIDAEELRSLLEEMEVQIGDEELKEAMEDLDLDGDKTISLEEFSLWYFSGMKPYGKGKKTLLSIGKNSKDALKSLGGGSLDAMDRENLKMHYQKLSFKYNRPQENGS
jgi:hypothetical protein